MATIVSTYDSYYYIAEDILKIIVSRKLLCSIIPYFLKRYGCPTEGFPMIPSLNIGDDYFSSIEENIYLIYEYSVCRSFNFFSQFDFQIYDVSGEIDTLMDKLPEVPEPIKSLVDETLLTYVERYKTSCEFAYGGILYHPYYNHFMNWVRANGDRLPQEFDILLSYIEEIFNSMYCDSTDPLTSPEEPGAAFPLVFVEDEDPLYCTESSYRDESIFAAFVLFCLVQVAKRRGYHTV